MKKNKNLIESQAKAMAIFIRNIYAKHAIFQKLDMFEETWKDFESILF